MLSRKKTNLKNKLILQDKMPEIEGILKEIEILKGRLGLQDVRINVGGIVFYKRIWEIDKKTKRKFKLKNIKEYSEDFIFPKKELFDTLQENKGNKIKIYFKEVNTSIVYFLLDRLNNLKIPKKYREIESIDYF